MFPQLYWPFNDQYYVLLLTYSIASVCSSANIAQTLRVYNLRILRIKYAKFLG